MIIKIFKVPRERDDAVLRWLRLHLKGYTPSEIGEMEAEKPATISASLTRVRDADLTESGESLQLVRRAYA